jgi:uncharacterized membrane protein
MKPSTRLIIAVVLGIIAISIAVQLLPFILGLLVVYYIYYRFIKKGDV